MSTPSDVPAIDTIQLKQEEIEMKLSYRFKWYTGVLVFATTLNTFFVVFHRYDSADSTLSLRYKLGYFFYMMNFFTQSLILLGTFIFSIILFIRLTMFLKPKNQVLDINGEEILSDDEFIDQRDSFEQKRDVIRRGFRTKYLSFNLQFIYLLVTLAVRTFTYVGLRLVSKEKMFEWIYIKPSVFYLTYATDVMILIGVMYFIY